MFQQFFEAFHRLDINLPDFSRTSGNPSVPQADPIPNTSWRDGDQRHYRRDRGRIW